MSDKETLQEFAGSMGMYVGADKAGNFDESKHPRAPAGSASGGEFTSGVNAGAGGESNARAQGLVAPKGSAHVGEALASITGGEYYEAPGEGGVLTHAVDFAPEHMAKVTSALKKAGWKQSSSDKSTFTHKNGFEAKVFSGTVEIRNTKIKPKRYRKIPGTDFIYD